MKRFFGKALRWGAILLATLLVLILAFYAEEDWRGARDWAACQRDLAAKGETLDLRQLVPPGNPADDLSKVPIFAEKMRQPRQSIEDQVNQKNIPHPLRLDRININLGAKDSVQVPPASSYLKGQSLDLTAWQKFYRSLPEAHLSGSPSAPAQDVLQALTQFDPEWNEITAALNNPNAYWGINYDEPFAESAAAIASMITVAKVLSLKGVAHLQNNQPDLAEKDYLFSFRINQTLSKVPSVLNFLISVGVRVVDNGILWEGLHRHTWNSNQLQEMEEMLASEDWLKIAMASLRGERARELATLNYMQSHDPDSPAFKSTGYDLSTFLRMAQIRPSGWWNQERRCSALAMQNYIDAFEPDNGVINPEVYKAPEKTLWKMLYIPLTTIAIPAFGSLDEQASKAETYQRLARLACRLEECRIAHGQYPEKLDDLPDLPPHLNQEVLSIQPLHYARKGDGYLLYSTGWDQKDDGGVIDKDPKQGDWVWPSP